MLQLIEFQSKSTSWNTNSLKRNTAHYFIEGIFGVYQDLGCKERKYISNLCAFALSSVSEAVFNI